MTALTDGVCYSTLPDYKITTICERIIPTDVLGSVTTDLTFLGVHTTAVLQTWATKTGGGAPASASGAAGMKTQSSQSAAQTQSGAPSGGARALPKTASSWPLLALVSILLLAVGCALNFGRRFVH